MREPRRFPIGCARTGALVAVLSGGLVVTQCGCEDSAKNTVVTEDSPQIQSQKDAMMKFQAQKPTTKAKKSK